MFYFFHKLFKILFFFDSAFYDFTHLSKTVVKKIDKWNFNYFNKLCRTTKVYSLIQICDI